MGGVPKFKTKLTGKDLKVGTAASSNSPYITGAGYCSPDSSFLGSSECANVGNFNGGRSLAVNNHKYRFPYFISPDDATKGPDALAAAYTNCAKNSLCIFITIPEPEGRKDLTVNYKFKTKIRTAAAAEKDLFPKEYTESLAREISNVNGGTNALVSSKSVPIASGTNLLTGLLLFVTMTGKSCTTALDVVCVTSRPASANALTDTRDTSVKKRVCLVIKHLRIKES